VRQDEASTFVADVYSDVLNAPTSRFQRRLVDSGLWQGVIVNYYTLDHTGPITISGQTSPEKYAEAVRVLLAELKATVTPGYVTAEEFAAAKASRAVTSAFGRERSSEFAHTIGFWWSVSGLDYYMKYVDEMARATEADLHRYANRCIIGRPHLTAVLVDPAVRRKLGLTESGLAGVGW
jgi:zinc protease